MSDAVRVCADVLCGVVQEKGEYVLRGEALNLLASLSGNEACRAQIAAFDGVLAILDALKEPPQILGTVLAGLHALSPLLVDRERSFPIWACDPFHIRLVLIR